MLEEGQGDDVNCFSTFCSSSAFSCASSQAQLSARRALARSTSSRRNYATGSASHLQLDDGAVQRPQLPPRLKGGGGGGHQPSDQGSIEGMERVAEPKSREEPLCFTATEHEAVPTLDTVSEDVIEMFEI
jgi:hypothetical protein